MIYVPVYCEKCARGSLAQAKGGEQQLLCSFCEGQTRPVPGPAYSDSDWLAFAEIDNAVFEAELDNLRAAVLADELQTMIDRDAGLSKAVGHVIERVPSLVSVRPALVSQPPRGLRMLVTSLRARLRDVDPQHPVS